ncbi:hypothetical protein K2173_000998 [Erythroxylum novogranatense]|uniref:50S ribosomal protein L17 n=1 Tax=Erythroxylum novogranatense TaxID=1862640 RepID=A0AAV8TSQ5_9ROSI|nr:hypothetical protein K2173_000998 [Erythroxylum novogranatense]
MTKFRKLSRPTGHRMSMLRSSFISHSLFSIHSLSLSLSLSLSEVLFYFCFIDSALLFVFVYLICRTMVSQLVKHERIETTVAKAKEIRRLADHMVQVGKEGTLCAARRAAGFVRGDDVLHKLFTELAYRYKDRAGGYTRLLRTRIRVGDAAPMAYIEFIDRENELRQSKPPTPQQPQRVPLDPWTKSRLSKQFAPPKEAKSSDSEI